jgi:hypothetical protein
MQNKDCLESEKKKNDQQRKLLKKWCKKHQIYKPKNLKEKKTKKKYL